VIKVFDAPLVEIINGTAGPSRHPQPGCSEIADFASINLVARIQEIITFVGTQLTTHA
jgi:hypothetical protein